VNVVNAIFDASHAAPIPGTDGSDPITAGQPPVDLKRANRATARSRAPGILEG
jgi:hypothetical protein